MQLVFFLLLSLLFFVFKLTVLHSTYFSRSKEKNAFSQVTTGQNKPFSMCKKVGSLISLRKYVKKFLSRPVRLKKFISCFQWSSCGKFLHRSLANTFLKLKSF